MEIEAGYTYGLIDAGKEIVLIGQELKRIDEKNSSRTHLTNHQRESKIPLLKARKGQGDIMSTNENSKQIEASLLAVEAIADAIRKLKEIPSGTLYAIVMGKMSLESYNGIISLLKRTKLISEKNNLLTWIG
jgi:hypothetical protein